MKRRDALTGIAACGLGLSLYIALAVNAQTPVKGDLIGFLSPVSRADDPFLDPFLQGLRDLGHAEGQTIAIEYRFAEGQTGRLPGLAADLVRRNVKVIVTSAPPAPMAAKKATSAIPIVFMVVGDPVAEGFVSSLLRPGGNITGLASTAPELIGKQLELLKALTPKLSRVAVLQNPSNHGHPPQLRQAEKAAGALGIRLHVMQVGSSAEIGPAFATMRNQRVEAVLVLRDPLYRTQRAELAALAAKSRLPAVYGQREYVEAGGLMSYGVNNAHLARRAATYVNKILKGAKAADLPVEQPTKFDFVINLKAAKAIGRTIPSALLQRVDEIIQ